MKPASHYGKWTEDETNMLIDMYVGSQLGNAEISKRLGRTQDAIRGRVHLLGLHRPSYSHWTTEEEENLLDLWSQPGLSIDDIVKQVGRSEGSLYGKVKQVSARAPGSIIPERPRKWSDGEIARLHKVYPDLSLSREQIMKEFPGKSWRQIRYQVETLKLQRGLRMQYTPVSDYFSEIDSNEKAYWLGLLAADGAVTGKNCIVLMLQKRDMMLVEEFRDAVCPDYILKEPPNRNVVGISFSDEKMRRDLERFGIVPRKSLTMGWPDSLPEQYSMPFILGMFDGDGCLSWQKRKMRKDGSRGGLWHWSLCATESMLIDVKRRIESHIDIEMGSIIHPKTTTMCHLASAGHKAIMIDAHMMRYDIGLKRKRITWHPHTLNSTFHIGGGAAPGGGGGG